MDQEVRSSVVSAWIKEMRLGNNEAALYWVHVALDNGISVNYLARRLAIFAVEDGWDPQAVAVGAAIETMADHAPRDWNAVAWGTAYMCQITKFWETDAGRRYEENRRSCVQASKRGETRPESLRTMPSYALDQHTVRGRALASTGVTLDDRFSGHFSGRAHMVAYAAKHGRLDPEVRDPEVEAATIGDAALRRSLGE